MKFYYYVIMLIVLLTSGCKIQKHMEVEKQHVEDNNIETVEETNKNTVRYITITKYVTVKDTATNEYPIESVTTIEERNNDKIVSTTKEEQHVEEQEEIKQDSKTDTSISTYIWCIASGAAGMLIIILLIKLVVWYIKKNV